MASANEFQDSRTAAAEHAAYTVEDILGARAYVYSFGQALFGNAPTEQNLEVLASELLEESLCIVGLDDAWSVRNALIKATANIEGLRTEYTKLFLGPNRLPVPLWESVYRTKSRELFQRETLDVRNAYRRQGFLPAEYPRVSDDHIALELGFLAQLSLRAAKANLDDDVSCCYEALEASKEFLQDHLLVWIGDFSSGLEKAAADSPYTAAARTIEAFSRRDTSLIDNLVTSKSTIGLESA
jgi:TorA maturation chaperone TorD